MVMGRESEKSLFDPAQVAFSASVSSAMQTEAARILH
jgi:hypothetical protein